MSTPTDMAASGTGRSEDAGLAAREQPNPAEAAAAKQPVPVKPAAANRHYAYFCNKECEYFPCHPTGGREEFNCLFCYCPLYVLGRDCGGDFRYLPNGRKDCSGCLFPHLPENYDAIIRRYGEIADVMNRNENAAPSSGRKPEGGAGSELGKY